jgi:hypothetical protein
MIDRRRFIKGTLGAAAACAAGRVAVAQPDEVLYNGIRLARPWPPVRARLVRTAVSTPPYLVEPPRVIPIDIGRQLFVDTFLEEECVLDRAYHAAEHVAANPIFKPEMPWETFDPDAERLKSPPRSAAMPFSDGVFYDSSDRVFKMWYMGGYGRTTCYALSDDGLEWRRPALDVVPGTNIVLDTDRDSSTVWLDHGAVNHRARYKMVALSQSTRALRRYVSPDGVHWLPAGYAGPSGDRSTFFYNAFRAVWVYSLRDDDDDRNVGRHRRYWESREFEGLAEWGLNEPVQWTAADVLDKPRADLRAKPELYNLDCVAYESVLLGLFSMFYGEGPAREKPNSLQVGFSRDGFHWLRPHREPFIPLSERPGDWNWANMQSAGGCCVVVGDKLFFYVSARTGVPGTGEPGKCSTGLATLRRDGFASLGDWDDTPSSVRVWPPLAPRSVTTRSVTFRGSTLYVNASVAEGELRAEILDDGGRVIPGFDAASCEPVVENATKIRIHWQHGGSLAELAGHPVRFRFYVRRGRLYSFWVSRTEAGASGGYVAAGGPGFKAISDD